MSVSVQYEERKPVMVVVAGPNGSGKTSLLRCLNMKSLVVGEWINADEIAEHDFGGWNDPPSIILAANEAERRRYDAFYSRRDFTFETVLSSPDKLDFIHMVQAGGYFVRAYFVGTESPVINAGRVMGRWLDGGHSVPIEKIASRYFRSMVNLGRLNRLVNQLQVFDNSVDDRVHQHVLSFVDGDLYRMRVSLEALPGWCRQVFGIDFDRSEPSPDF